MIVFGGVIFWIIVIAFLLVEVTALYNEAHGFAFLPPAIFVLLMIFVVTGAPTFDLKLLLLWPIGSILWLPCFWYVSLRRRAAKVRKYVKDNGKITESLERSRMHDMHIEWDKTRNNIKILHPDPQELSINAIMFPVSAPIFIFDTWIDAGIEALKSVMDKVRNSISDAANR